MSSTQIRRLAAGDAGLARKLFSAMASVFGEGSSSVSEAYASSLMDRDDVWVAADNDDLHALDFYRSLGGTASAVTIFTFSK